MSLKAIAEQELARLKAGEITHETKKETEMKHVKQEPHSCFTGGSVCFMPVKQGLQRKTAKNELCFTVSSPQCETHETSFPKPVTDGLQRLRSMPAPRGVSPAVWAEVVADALSLARDGWAAKAIALGWSPLDLFGVVPDSLGDPADDGLAVWLGGRRLIALCGTYAVVKDDGGGRSYFNRRQAEGAVLLWRLGK